VDEEKVLWAKVGGLSFVQASITLAWVAYHLYLPGMLAQMGMSSSVAGWLLVAEGIIGLLLEPLNGLLSDRFRRKLSARFLQILVGVAFSALLFAAMPFVSGPLFLGIVLAWAMAMTVFRAPAISLLWRYATPQELPRASSLVIAFGGLASAFGGLFQDEVLALGPIPTFLLSSLVLIVAAVVLRALDPTVPGRIVEDEPEEANLRPTLAPALLILGLGFFFSLGFAMLRDDFAGYIATHQMVNISKAISGGIFLAVGVTAYASGLISAKRGVNQGLLIGLGSLVPLVGLSFLATEPFLVWSLVVLFGTAIGLVFTNAIPFAFRVVPSGRVGWAVGLYFGGGSLAAALGAFFGSTLKNMDPQKGLIFSAALFSAAAVCAILGGRYLPRD
jgi:predicted MFS family arabinose efflux permease